MSIRTEVAAAVRAYIAKHYILDDDDMALLKDDTPLVTGGVIDSFGAIKLIVHLESLFGVTVHYREFALDSPDCAIDSIAAIVRMVCGKKGADS